MKFPPVKRGTAQRLGLRPPRQPEPPAAILTIRNGIVNKDEFRRRFFASMGGPPFVLPDAD